jgi:hypothetical protein
VEDIYAKYNKYLKSNLAIISGIRLLYNAYNDNDFHAVLHDAYEMCGYLIKHKGLAKGERIEKKIHD